MNSYKRLSDTERDRIAVLRSRGLPWREIAQKLRRHHTSLLREWRRNRKGSLYGPHAAQRQALERQRESHKRLRLGSRVLQYEVEQGLMRGDSPELIAGRFALAAGHRVISHEAIYQWIYRQAPHLVGYLIRAHAVRRQRRASPRPIRIPERVSLTERPAAANRREEPGHWEADLLVGPGRAALQVAVERASRYLRLVQLPDKTARSSREALSRVFERVPETLRRSVTYDNGSENVEHVQLKERFRLKSFFCAPYHSWEKGSVENANGILRRFWPKGTNLGQLSEVEIQRVQDFKNNRPMKCLGYRTPAEVFRSLGAIAP